MDDYLLRYLGQHLYKAGRYDDLLKQIEDLAWSRAQYTGLGSHASYLEDLKLGIQIAESYNVKGLPLLLHYSFLDALVRASAGEVRSNDIAAQALGGALQPALERASAIPDPASRVKALAGVARAAITRGQRALAGQVVDSGLAAANEIPAGLAQFNAWIELAAIQIDLGSAAAARGLLDKALDGLAQEKDPLVEQQDPFGAKKSSPWEPATQSTQHKKSGSGQENTWSNPEYANRQMAAMRAYSDEQRLGGVAEAYAGIVLSCARLGDISAAKRALDAFSTCLVKRKKAYTIVEPLAACTLKLIEMGLTDLATAVVDTLVAPGAPAGGKGEKQQASSLLSAQLRKSPFDFTAGLSETSSFLDTGSYSGPFGDSKLAEFAIDLAKAQQPRLAMRVVGEINFGKYENFSDRTLASVLENITDRDMLMSLTGDIRIKQGERAAAVLVRQLARVSETEVAHTLARLKGAAGLGELAGVLLAKGDWRGRDVLNEALALAKKQKDSYSARDDLGNIAATLGRAGLPNEALAVWESRGKAADPGDDAGPGAEIARSMAGAGRVSEAVAFAERLRRPLARCRALSAVGLELSKAGDKAHSRELFEKARLAAPGIRSMDDRDIALTALLNDLLEAAEFDTAFEVAKSLDRLSAAAAVSFEPGLILRKAKDVLAQAVGFDADEDVSMDLSPDNQVKVIEAIAEHGDYKLARQLASKIKNSWVKKDLVEAVARSAAAAGDLDAAFEMAGTLDEDDANYFLDDLQAQAANQGEIGQELASGGELFYGALLTEMALRIQIAAAAPDTEAVQIFDAYAGMACEMLVDEKDEDARNFGEWLLPRLLALTIQSGSGRGLQQIQKQLEKARKMVRSDSVDTDYVSAVKDAAVDLMEAGYVEGAGLYVPLLGSGWFATELSFEIACHQVYFGNFQAASRAYALPLGEYLDEKVKARLYDQLAGSVVLGLAGGGQIPQAREALARLTNTQLRADLTWVIDALQAARQGRRNTPHQDDPLASSNRFKAISTMLLSFILRELVAAGNLEAARALIERASPLGAESDKESRLAQIASFGSQITFGAIDRLSDALRYLNVYDTETKTEFHSDRPALAFIRQAADSGMRSSTLPPAWVLDMIESSLAGTSRLTALAVLADWLLKVTPAPPAGTLDPVWRAFESAQRGGIADVALHAAGFSPLLYGLGGKPLVLDAIDRLSRIKEQWTRK